MSNTGAEIKPEAVREVAFGSINSTYTAFGPVVVGYSRYMLFDNSTDVDIYVSKDGVTNQWRVRAGTSKIYDLKTNDSFLGRGDQLSVKYRGGVAPTRGDFFAELAYT